MHDDQLVKNLGSLPYTMHIGRSLDQDIFMFALGPLLDDQRWEAVKILYHSMWSNRGASYNDRYNY